MTLEDRPRGILSPADRRYLKNPEEYSDQAAYERRGAIVTRVHEALHDFSLLVSKLDGDRRRKAFEDRDLEHKDHTMNVLPSVFAFLYLGITDTTEPADLAKDAFEGMIAEGTKQAYYQRGVSVRGINVDIDVTPGKPLDELEDKENLTFAEAWQLFETGRLSDEEAAGVFIEANRGEREVGNLTPFPGLKQPESVDIPDSWRTTEE